MTLIFTKMVTYFLTVSVTFNLGIGLLQPESVYVDICLITVITKMKNQK